MEPQDRSDHPTAILILPPQSVAPDEGEQSSHNKNGSVKLSNNAGGKAIVDMQAGKSKSKRRYNLGRPIMGEFVDGRRPLDAKTERRLVRLFTRSTLRLEIIARAIEEGGGPR